MESQFGPRRGLDRVTLCCVTSRDLALSEKALLRCTRHLSFGRVILFSPGIPSSPKLEHVTIQPFTSNKDYDRFVLFELVKHVATDFVLIIHFDGFVLNPDAWNEDFLSYDYIGARWPWHADKQVGNGGFCLRSIKLLRALAHPRFERPEIPEDELICRIERDYLEKECGIRFAPNEIADAFSLEHADIPRTSFGFHGLFHLHLAYRDVELDEAMKLMNPSVYAGGNALLWFQALVLSGGHRILIPLAQKILAAQNAEILSRNCAIYGFPPVEVALALARAVSR